MKVFQVLLSDKRVGELHLPNDFDLEDINQLKRWIEFHVDILKENTTTDSDDVLPE